jgi:shikimate kinase
MKERNIALIGFRATGKSAVGKPLAEKLGRVFIDMDLHLTACAGRDIACWVRMEGWASFRRAESELLAVLGSRENLVVATGGGVVLNPENRRVLKERFFTVWLKAGPETIYSRISADPLSPANRPALSDMSPQEEIRALLAERAPLYAEVADLEIYGEGKSVPEIVEAIARSME